MLFTDGIILNSQDLREHDNYILEVASTEGIELSSKLATAQRQTGYDLASYLSSQETPLPVNRVVVTEELRDLLALQTLTAVYRDAYNRQLNDRYKGRWKEFSEASDRSLRRYLQNGIGIVGVAVSRAEKPSLTAVDGGGLAAGSYSIQVAWQHINGTVGEKSLPVLIELAGGSLHVTTSSAPANMRGWHVFIGMADGSPSRQNQSPVAPGAAWTQAAGLRSDLHGPDASGPDYYVRSTRQLVRR